MQEASAINPARLATVEKKGRQEPALLNERQSAELLGVGVRKFHELRGEPWMPLAVELGPRALRWRRDELLEAIATRAPRRTIRAEPEHLAARRHDAGSAS